MGDPYLSSDESLILSTHNILIDGVSLDLMLTSRRLILIDNSVNPFQLRTIPLDTIITVVAGINVTGEPIITLTHMDPSVTGAPLPMDFVFTRQKGEQRAKECNDWAATLSNLATGARNGALSAGTLPYDPVKTIQPRMSATYMIETFSPRKSVMEEYPIKAEPVTTPVPLKSPADDQILTGVDESAPLKNAEITEPPGAFELPSMEQRGTVISGTEDPVSSPRAIAIEADRNPAIAEAEELVSFPQAIVIESDQNPAIAEAEEPVSPPQAIASETNENPVIVDVEEPASPPQIIAIVSDEKTEISDAAQAWADAVRTVTTPSPVIPQMMITETKPAGKNTDDKPKEEPITTTVEEPLAEINNDIRFANDEPVKPLFPKADTVPPAISPGVPKIPKSTSPTFLIAAIVLIGLVVLGVAVMGPFNLLNFKETSPSVVVPVITIQPTLTPIPTLVPADGVWVRIEYPGTFIGEVGNPELMHPAYGSGVRIYKILWSERIVKASAQKQENSGDALTIEIYNNGTLIKRSSTRAPMGSVNILIDPTTGQPPGVKQEDIP